MNNKSLRMALGGFLILGSLAAPAAQIGAPDEKNTLQQLLAENKNLSIKLDDAKKAEGQIAKAQLANDGAHSALKHAQQELKQLRSGLMGEGRNIQQQAQQAGCPWGGTSKDKGFVNACNAEGRRLTEMLNDVLRRGASLEEYEHKLTERQTSLGNDTLKLFKKKKSNYEDLELLYAARADWQQRYNAFVFRSETYERLKKTAPASQLCVPMSAQPNAEELRSAAHCLERLWDGAR